MGESGSHPVDPPAPLPWAACPPRGAVVRSQTRNPCAGGRQLADGHQEETCRPCLPPSQARGPVPGGGVRLLWGASQWCHKLFNRSSEFVAQRSLQRVLREVPDDEGRRPGSHFLFAVTARR